MKVIVKKFSVDITTWSNKEVAKFLNSLLNPNKPSSEVRSLTNDQRYKILSTFGSLPKLPATFKEIYQQFKQHHIKPKDTAVIDLELLKNYDLEPYEGIKLAHGKYETKLGIFGTNKEAKDAINRANLELFKRVQLLVKKDAPNRTYYVVEYGGVDGSKYLGTMSYNDLIYRILHHSGYWDVPIGFTKRLDAEEYLGLCNSMASYYTGDPNQNYNKIQEFQEKIDKFLNTHNHVR